VRVAKAAIDAGVEERQVLAAVIRAILTDLGHDPADEHVREVVRRRLTEGNGDRQLPPGRP
jgi:hypothetical protein